MEIKFKRDTSFRKQFFVPDSFAHPAKMDAQLLIWIVENYTSAGEVVLDPMAGSGTMMLACTLGRHCILVELEGKFCKMCADNWAEVKMRPQLGYSMGDCQIIQGDARNLGGMLCDKIISSPPFFNTNIKKRFKTRKELEEFAKKTKLYKEGRSVEAICRMIEKNWNAEEGLLADKIITSPPYADLSTCQETSKNEIERRIRKGIRGAVKTDNGKYMTGGGHRQERYSDNSANIGNLPYGDIDKIITSPPFAGNKGGLRSAESFMYGNDELGKRMMGGIKGGTGDSPENIDSLPYGNIDKIITSPPYEEAVGRPRRKTLTPVMIDKYAGAVYPDQDNRQIGNLKGDTYLEAMALVYSQCFTVLKDGGLMILVTKNFIRDKQVVRLDSDTIKLCEQAGFNFIERHFRRLLAQSFWRTIYQQKYPDVEVIQNEDVLIFKKA